MTKSAEILNGKLHFFAVADDLDCDDDFHFLHGILNVFSCSIFLLVEILLKFLFDFLSTLACSVFLSRYQSTKQFLFSPVIRILL